MANFTVDAPLEVRAEQAMAFAQEQVAGLITAHPDYFPLYTEEGKWQHGKQSWTNCLPMATSPRARSCTWMP